MAKPCIEYHPTYQDDCRLCFLATNDPAYQELWNISTLDTKPLTASTLAKSEKISLPCYYVGKSVPPPPDKDPRKSWYICDRGNGIQCGCSCPDSRDCYVSEEVGSRPAPRIPQRHLVCHVLPVDNGQNAWKRSIDQIKGRWELFTGRKLFAVAQGTCKHKLVSIQEVRDYLPPGSEVIPIQNVPSLREVASWEPLWSALRTTARNEDCVLYCHAKGSTRPVDPGNSCHWWASLMWSLVLDHWNIVEKKLSQRPICGPFKKVGMGFGHRYGKFHYSGTFYWLKFGDFNTRWPRIEVPRTWWGTEAWPGMAYAVEEAEWIFMEGRVSFLDLYNPKFWDSTVRGRYSQWIRENPPFWNWKKEVPIRSKLLR